MVGVPGRSKGCNTCRQRRIKCSLERPVCSQCAKSKRLCTGYQRHRVFIVNDAASIHSNLQQNEIETVKKRSSTKPRGKTIAKTEQYAAVQYQPIPIPVDAESAQLSEDASTSTALVVQSPATNISHGAIYQQQIISQFLRRHMPSPAKAGPRWREMLWLTRYNEIATPAPAMEKAVLALCTARLGRAVDDMRLVREGSKFYVDALREMQQALWSPERMYRDETLAAAMALLMFEVIECPEHNVNGWVSHFDGCSRLVQLRGPEAHSTPLGHQLFVSYRINGIHQAIRRKKRTFLSKPEWCSLPWKGNVPRTPMDDLLDILARLTDVFLSVAGEGYEPSPPPSPDAVIEAINTCWKIDAELTHFHQNFQQMNMGPLYWPNFSTKENPADSPQGKVFPIALQFPYLGVAHTCMLEWGGWILLSSTLQIAYNLVKTASTLSPQIPLPEAASSGSNRATSVDIPHIPTNRTTIDTSHLPPLSPHLEIAELCKNICQSMEFCLQEEMGEMGTMVAIIPLTTALDMYSLDPTKKQELAWAAATLENIKTRVRLMRFLDVVQ